MINQCFGELHYLTGFKNNRENGEGISFNFVFSNGDRFTQIDEHVPTYFTHLIPADSLKMIRSVLIHYLDGYHIAGFSFFDNSNSN